MWFVFGMVLLYCIVTCPPTVKAWLLKVVSDRAIFCSSYNCCQKAIVIRTLRIMREISRFTLRLGRNIRKS